jgi:CheY-like chemotaxis protein
MKHLLIIEDNDGDVYLLRETLREAHIVCDLMHIRDGATAVDVIEHCAIPYPDLILVDLNLPGRSGADIVQALMSSPYASHSAIAVLTSSDTASDKQKLKDLGLQHYLVKPFDLDELPIMGQRIKQLLGA